MTIKILTVLGLINILFCFVNFKIFKIHLNGSLNVHVVHCPKVRTKYERLKMKRVPFSFSQKKTAFSLFIFGCTYFVRALVEIAHRRTYMYILTMFQ